MNRRAAKEWLNKAWHHFSSGKLLYEVNHYTDVIGIDLYYAIEISLKIFLAYEYKKIIKTHDLIEIHSHIVKYIDFNEDKLELLDIVSTYYVKGFCPPKDRKMPSRDELKKVVEFANELYSRVCNILDIDEKNVKSVRPRYGLHTRCLLQLLGKKAKQDYNMGDRIDFELL